MLRAMLLEYPDDRPCRYPDTQYMLGSALLVAPVFDPEGKISYYLPEGEWRNFLTGEVTRGQVWRSEKHGYLSLGLWVNIERGTYWDCLSSSALSSQYAS